MKTYRFTCCLILCLGLFGCQPTPVPFVKPTEAVKDLQQLLADDYNLTATVKQIGTTVWVYMPIEGGIYNLKADPTKPTKPKLSEAEEIKLLEGEFENRNFNIRYDVAPTRKYLKSQTYKYEPSEKFAKAQRFIFTALKRVYPPKKQNRDEAGIIDEHYPEFFVLHFSDIVNGLEYKIILNLDDYHRSTHDPGFSEEYQRRLVQLPLEGNIEIIGDKEGERVAYKEILWPEFLMKQALGRIQFKYTTSAFDPSKETEKEFLKQVAITLSAYGFDSFEAVKMTNLQTSEESVTSKETLFSSFPLYQNKSSGKTHVIKFDNFGQIKSVTEEEGRAPQTEKLF